MTPWKTLAARAAVLASPDIDTDKILPARYMKGLEREGLGKHLFADVRASDPAYGLPTDPRIIVAGRNFGSGSSREHAVWALTGRGIGCIVAPSFGSIFAGNAASNGLLLATVTDTDLVRVIEVLTAKPDAIVTVDLVTCSIGAEDLRLGFAIDPAIRGRLIEGLDDIARTLLHADAIAAFERQRDAGGQSIR